MPELADDPVRRALAEPLLGALVHLVNDLQRSLTAEVIDERHQVAVEDLADLAKGEDGALIVGHAAPLPYAALTGDRARVLCADPRRGRTLLPAALGWPQMTDGVRSAPLSGGQAMHEEAQRAHRPPRALLALSAVAALVILRLVVENFWPAPNPSRVTVIEPEQQDLAVKILQDGKSIQALSQGPAGMCGMYTDDTGEYAFQFRRSGDFEAAKRTSSAGARILTCEL